VHLIKVAVDCGGECFCRD